jgi:DNA-binding NtrC family response regulator
MAQTPTFLVVDFHTESRFLLVKTLLRKFPSAFIQECEDVVAAVEFVKSQKVAAAVAHRTFDTSGHDLVQALRAADPALPIVMVSGFDRAKEARHGGADTFLLYDEWLRIAVVVDELMTARDASKPRVVALGESSRQLATEPE